MYGSHATGRMVRVVVATCAAALGATVLAGTATALPAHHKVPRWQSNVQEYFFGWSDNRAFTARTFVQTDYADPTSLPDLVVTVDPPLPKHMVTMEFLQDGEWVAESVQRTSDSGVAHLTVDPLCRDAMWCSGTYRYRLRIGGMSAPITISYFRH